jgi:hypothetical protein
MPAAARYRLAEQGSKRRSVEHVDLEEPKCRHVRKVRDVASPTEAQIVHAPDLIAPIQQPVAKMAADEAHTACE